MKELFLKFRRIYFRAGFGNKGTCKPLQQDELRAKFEGECEKCGILYKMKDIIREAKQK